MSELSRSEASNVLLMLLPFWDPQIPPLGISCLKSFVQARERRFNITTIDANTQEVFRELYGRYFEVLKRYIPIEQRRHLYNIGPDVLRNHAMAHLNYENRQDYVALIKDLVYHTFYSDVEEGVIDELIRIVEEYYQELEGYVTGILSTYQPSVLGLSVYSGTLPASLFAFQLAKKKYPSIINVMGGGIFSSELCIGTSNFEGFLKRALYLDKIIVGEGELLFYELLQGRLPSSQRVFTLEDTGHQTVELDQASTVDFSDFNLEYYTQMAGYTARSCPFHCSFCVEKVYWGKYRKRTAQRIIAELQELYQRHGNQLFLMCDSLLNPVIDDLSRGFLESRVPLYWGGYLRADRQVCDPANTLLWRRGGFYRARLGIESGSQRILDTMEKKIHIQQIKDAVTSLAQAGIKTTAMFVIGSPGETREDFQHTLDLVEELQDDIYEADCNPFWYFENGQVGSEQWSAATKKIPLYPGASDMLLLQTWVLDTPPSRQERYHRVNEFVLHCNQLGIPNPYTLDEVYNADQRWKQLHKHAVPPLLDFQSNESCIEECRHIKALTTAQNTQQLGQEDDWDF